MLNLFKLALFGGKLHYKEPSLSSDNLSDSEVITKMQITSMSRSPTAVLFAIAEENKFEDGMSQIQMILRQQCTNCIH